MKTILFLIVLLHTVFSIGQETEGADYNFQNKSLCLGDTMSLGEKEIKFKKILSDSRCPKGNGITCIWAGEVTVLVEFYENGKFVGDKVIAGTNLLKGQTEIISSASISLNEFFNTDGLKINKILVSPYPEGGKKISPEEYSVHLQIAEKIETD